MCQSNMQNLLERKDKRSQCCAYQNVLFKTPDTTHPKVVVVLVVVVLVAIVEVLVPRVVSIVLRGRPVVRRRKTTDNTLQRCFDYNKASYCHAILLSAHPAPLSLLNKTCSPTKAMA